MLDLRRSRRTDQCNVMQFNISLGPYINLKFNFRFTLNSNIDVLKSELFSNDLGSF